jgi:uncharacterized SAM-binding protein YcdF (DUF218 family)
LLRARHLLLVGFLLLLTTAGAAEYRLYQAVRRQATHDEARPAEAIVVFGAAQYNGAPSPVFKARLDHAFDLEDRDLAPLVITTGGAGGDSRFTEGGVGRDYLIQRGVAAARIIAETQSQTTYENVRAAAQILRQRGGHTCIPVSDGFHLYRIQLMLAAEGITAFSSPAPLSPLEADPFQRTLHSLREALICGLWYLHIRG